MGQYDFLFGGDQQDAFAQEDNVRRALNDPVQVNASDVVRKDQVASQLGESYGAVDASLGDLEREAQARHLEQTPGANEWLKDKPENAALLKEDNEALTAIHDAAGSLQSQGIALSDDGDDEAAMDDVMASAKEGQEQPYAEEGFLDKAWQRGQLSMEMAVLGNKARVTTDPAELESLRRQAEDLQRRMTALKTADPTGLGGAVEQLPRMLSWDLTKAGEWGLAGASTGAAAAAAAAPFTGGLSALGAPVTAGAGALAGFTAGMVAGGFISARDMEQGMFAFEQLLEKDDAGQYINNMEDVAQASEIYGNLSGLVEVGGDVVMGKIMGLGRALGLGKLIPKGMAAKDAIKLAAKNKSFMEVFKRFGLGVTESALTEGGQEATQEGLSAGIESWMKQNLKDKGENFWFGEQPGIFSKDTMSRMLEAGWEAAKTGPWFFAIPGSIRMGVELRDAQRARDYAEAHKELADKVAASKITADSPARMESYLQLSGMNGDVLIPADAALEMQNKGIDLCGPLGWEQSSLEEAAAMGQDISIPAARLHARLGRQPEVMKQLADVIREAPERMSAVEAEYVNEYIDSDIDSVIEAAEEDAVERSAIEGETERLRAEMTEAIKSTKKFYNQIMASADPETTLANVVEDNLRLLILRGMVLNKRGGASVSDFLSEFTVQGLVEDEDGRMVTPEQAERNAETRARQDALEPFWSQVWGRLDMDSLRADFPEEIRSLVYRHGRGLFAKKGEGVAVDELADELKTRGLLGEGTNDNDLVMKLLEMERPTWRRRRKKVIGAGQLFQQGAETGIPENPFVALHNISADNLLRASALGGLPVPSIGITKADMAYTGFGEISLIGSRDMIDPQRTPVFSGDAYTARVPRPIWASVKTPKIKELRKQVGKYFSAVNDDSALSAIVWKMTDDPNVDDAVRYFINSAGGRAAYLASQGADISSETEQTLKEKVNRDDPDFVRFANETIAGKFDEPKIELGRKKVPMTLNNIVAAMISSQVKNKEKMMTFSDGVLNAATSVRIKDLEELNVLRDRVTDEETAHARKSEQEALTSSYRDKVIKRYSGSSTWDALDDSMMALAEAAKKKGNTAKNIIAALKKKDFVDVTEEDVEDGVKAIQLIREGLTSYFEAKPQRAVGLDEFKGAVVPENAGPEVLRVLEANGIPYQTYTTQDDRRSKVQSMSMELAMQTPGVLFQRAFHGTPFNFDKFTLDHIGAGEGAQVHGWGLYFAKNREVSDDYRNGLSKTRTTYRVGKKTYHLDMNDRYSWLDEKDNAPAEHILFALRQMRISDGNKENAISALRKKAEEWGSEKNPESKKTGRLFAKGAQWLEDNNIETQRPTSQLYEVEIPDDDVLLDEEKRFYAQPEKVKDALKKLGIEDGRVFDMKKRRFLTPSELKRKASFGNVADEIDYLRTQRGYIVVNDMMTGEAIYSLLREKYGSAEAASKALNKAGVKGITYDGMRDGRCFVVFDDKSIQILEKFYQFLGEQGAANLDAAQEVTTRMDNLVVAREMETAGKDALAIKHATGWERGADGKWRYETDDSGVTYHPSGDALFLKDHPEYRRFRELEQKFITGDLTEAEREEVKALSGTWGGENRRLAERVKNGSATLENMLDDQELFAAYPDLRKLPVKTEDLPPGTQGFFDGEKIVLSSGLSPEEARSTLLHEVQHAVQAQEGFARGGNEGMFEDKVLDAERLREEAADARSQGDEARAEELETRANEIEENGIDGNVDMDGRIYEDTFQAYRSLSGEVEARNVQRRMEMDMDDRREFLARETEDVAREDQIFLKNGLNAAMMSQEPADYAKGMTTPLDDGRYIIQLFQAADLSTMAHEFAHAMFLDMQARVRNGTADPQTVDDMATLNEWLGQLDDDAKLKEQYDRYLKNNPAFAGREFETLDFTEKALAKGFAGQEMLARAWESYLREGKAPSKKMEGVFRRFAKWLKKVYRDITQLDVQISDEVREVFDRMIATDDEMDAAAADAGIREETQRMLDALGLQGADRLEMEGLITAAKEEAVDKLRRARDKEWRDRRARWLQEAREQVEKEQPYITKAALRKTPVDIDAIKAQLGEGVAEAMRKAMPGSLKQGGQIPDVMAAELGYDSVEAMVRDVVESPRKNERIKQIVEQKQLEHDAMFPADDFLWEQEQIAEQQTLIAKALHKKLTGEREDARKAREAQNVYRDELAGDTLNRQPVRPAEDEYQMYGKRARFYVAREAITKAAKAYLEKQDLQKAMQPGRYRIQASKWVNEERRAILRGDWEKAAEANYKARLNIELAKQAADLRDMVDKVRKQSKRWLEGDYSQALKWADEKQRDALAGARFAVLLLSHNMGLFNPTRKMLANANDKGMDDIAKFLRYAGEMGYLDVEPQPDGSVICHDIEGRLFKEAIDMKTSPTSEVRPYLEAIAQIMHIDRAERKSVTDEGKADFSEFTQGIADNILALNSRRDPGSFAKRNAFIQTLREFHAAHLKADTILMLLDGDDMGPAWQAIMRPINRATWWRADRLKKEGQALKNLFSVYTRKELVDMKGKRYFVQAIGESITKEQALAILLNCGNADNLQRVMAGFKLKNGNTLTEAQVAAIIDTLDEKDVKFAQSVWDYFETFRKESFDLQESITGVRPDAVQAQPLRTKYGELRGGYYPIVYDKTQSAKPIDTETIGTQTGGMWASVDYGSMKQRTATGLGTALSLSIDVIPQHVARTVHMLAFRKPVIEVSRILNAKNVNNAIQETAGVETTKALQSWLHYVAGERPAKTGWSKACAWARRNAGLYTMGFKLTTMLAQMTGLLATTAELGPKWTMVGVFQTVRAPLEAWHLATTSSAMMRHRIHAVDREVWEQSTKMMDTGSTNRIADPAVRLKRFIDDKAYVPMGWVQMIFADMPTWQGAYAKAMHENGGDMKAAAEYADAMVERTQVGGSEKDLAAVQRGAELGKLMTMFYSYFSAVYQLSARRITMLHRSGYKSGAAWWRLGTLAMLTWFAEPVIAGLLTRKSPDDDDDDEWGRFNEPEFWKWAAKEALLNPFNMVVYVRDIASAVDGMVEGYNRGFRLSSALDFTDSYFNFVRQVYKAIDTGEVDEKKLILKGGKAFGQTTGLVNAQEMLLLERIWDWLDGTDPDVELGDLIRKKKK